LQDSFINYQAQNVQSVKMVEQVQVNVVKQHPKPVQIKKLFVDLVIMFQITKPRHVQNAEIMMKLNVVHH
jgi:hypothetical protein